ncbi:TRAFAC clade GTPase domain-containing protein [Actinokineospora cianjurensis]|uniref:Double-GTPase 2 domain-containing protein n=1 Tax=Actinokineospora cianjurensis TaxID=585224 RepID=A0A421AVZ5_9PSEU|nr:hypothetical protein [Actinokineospora cianjurensis]RLK54188.1 hypothetical protein CLV68_6191 [Actinokineospora cianjurensis]
MASLTCPYCWKQFAKRELRHQCGQACRSEARVFPASEMKKGACPHGRTPQARRLCPHCDRQLLREYLESSGTSIAVIGSADAGKSTWVGTLIHEFMKGETGERFPGTSLDLLGEDSRIRYVEKFEVPLYSENRTVDKTRTAATDKPEPLIFSMRFPTRSLIGSSAVRPVVTAFYDTAGEDVTRSTGMDQLNAYLNAADGIILLLDPLQMRGARERVDTADRPAITEQLHVLNRLSELLREGGRGSVAKKLDTPLAIALTKVDLLRDTFGEQSPLRTQTRHVGHYSEDEGMDIHEDVRAWLDRWYDPSFDRSVANNFGTYRYFGLSALGAAPVSRTQLARTGVHPYRVEDPMLWLLSRFRAIKTVRGKR